MRSSVLVSSPSSRTHTLTHSHSHTHTGTLHSSPIKPQWESPEAPAPQQLHRPGETPEVRVTLWNTYTQPAVLDFTPLKYLITPQENNAVPNTRARLSLRDISQKKVMLNLGQLEGRPLKKKKKKSAPISPPLLKVSDEMELTVVLGVCSSDTWKSWQKKSGGLTFNLYTTRISKYDEDWIKSLQLKVDVKKIRDIKMKGFNLVNPYVEKNSD